MALRNPMIHQPIVVPNIHHPGPMACVPHPPGVQFGGIRGPVPNSFVPMQVTRQSIHQQPRAQQAHPPPHPPPAGSEAQPKKERKKEVQKSLAEQQVPPTSTSESSGSVASPATTGRAQNQDRPVSSSKPPGSRLAIRFNGP